MRQRNGGIRSWQLTAPRPSSASLLKCMRRERAGARCVSPPDVLFLAQATAQKSYAPIQRLVEEQRELAIAGIRKLETGPKPVTYSTLRNLRTLVTPTARAAIIPILTAPRRPQLQKLEEAILKACTEMWIDFHWSLDNPNLSAEVGAPTLFCPHVCGAPMRGRECLSVVACRAWGDSV